MITDLALVRSQQPSVSLVNAGRTFFNRERESMRRRILRSVAFTLVATGLALPFAAGFRWSAHGGPSWVGTVSAMAYMTTPLIAAVGFARHDGEPPSVRLALGVTWRRAWLAAIWLPLVGAAGLTFLRPGITFDPAMGGLMARLEGAARDGGRCSYH